MNLDFGDGSILEARLVRAQAKAQNQTGADEATPLQVKTWTACVTPESNMIRGSRGSCRAHKKKTADCSATFLFKERGCSVFRQFDEVDAAILGPLGFAAALLRFGGTLGKGFEP